MDKLSSFCSVVTLNLSLLPNDILVVYRTVTTSISYSFTKNIIAYKVCANKGVEHKQTKDPT